MTFFKILILFTFTVAIVPERTSAQTKGICCDWHDEDKKILGEIQEFLLHMEQNWKRRFGEDKSFPTLKSFGQALLEMEVKRNLKETLSVNKKIEQTPPSCAGGQELPTSEDQGEFLDDYDKKLLKSILNQKRGLALAAYLKQFEQVDDGQSVIVPLQKLIEEAPK